MSRLSFVITVASEPPGLLCQCLSVLRTSHWEARVVVIADGTRVNDHRVIADDFGARYLEGECLKTLSKGALWWKRFFLVALEDAGDPIFKLDPDAVIWRPFRQLPEADFFGSLRERGTSNEHIQGGCEGFSRAFAERVIASGIADDPRYCDAAHWSSARRLRWAASRRPADYLSTDRVIMKIARDLGTAYANYDEIGSNGSEAPKNPRLRYAVTHPHKWKGESTRPIADR